MVTPYVMALVWIICGLIAWRIATRRQASGALWAVLGQVFGPFSIPFSLFAGPGTRSHT